MNSSNRSERETYPSRGKRRIIIKFIPNKNLCPFAYFDEKQYISLGRARNNGFNCCTQRAKNDGIKQIQRDGSIGRLAVVL